MKRIIALGFFDGVHLGHGALLKRAVALADELGAVPAAHTFAAHPSALLSETAVPLLSTPEDRAYLMETLYGVREVLVAPFDRRMMTMDWADFVTGHLVGELDSCGVVVGEDHRFGYKGRGTAEKLEELCGRLGLACCVVEKVTLDGKTVSSTLIRELLAAGDVETANRYLAHPHLLRGAVAHGKGLGKDLGFPTLNITPAPGILLPAYGVYAAKVRLADGKTYPAAVNVGVRPTIEDGDAVSVEAFLLDFAGDVYGQTVSLEFYKRLRGERRFDGLEDLRREVARNARQTREYFAGDTTPEKA